MTQSDLGRRLPSDLRYLAQDFPDLGYAVHCIAFATDNGLLTHDAVLLEAFDEYHIDQDFPERVYTQYCDYKRIFGRGGIYKLFREARVFKNEEEASAWMEVLMSRHREMRVPDQSRDQMTW